MRRFIFLFSLLLCCAARAGTVPADVKPDEKIKFPLPLPSAVGAEKFCAQLNKFLIQKQYAEWKHDAKLRMTGPFTIHDSGEVESLGTHGPSAVQVFYSPQVMQWLESGQKGAINDGEMIVKVLHARLPEDPSKFSAEPTAFSVMVKDSKRSWDGWFYTDGGPLMKPHPQDAPNFFDPNAGYALSCVNCHASVDNLESTFSSLRNLGDKPIEYATKISPVGLLKGLQQPKDIHSPPPAAEVVPLKREVIRWPYLDKKVRYPEIGEPLPIPFATYDHVVQGPRPDGRKHVITSSNCQSCHDAVQLYSVRPHMTITEKMNKDELVLSNLSPYSEWRYSMMGLSGRDPVFLAQLESERILYPEIAEQIDHTCLSCHSPMAARQVTRDRGAVGLLTHQMALGAPGTEHEYYGALGRDGVSCVICHQMQPDGLGTPATYTGRFKLPDKPDHVFGPYEKTMVLPMEQAMGLTPKQGVHISESKLCATCHTVKVPVLESGKKYTPAELAERAAAAEKPGHHHEQATYLEWKNSNFSTEPAPKPTSRSCQDCHMPRDYKGQKLNFRIANIQDDTFPDVDHLAPKEKIHLEDRDRYSRHALHGINLFTLEMFNQNPWLLGVARKDNLLPAGRSGFDLAIESGKKMATEETARIAITKTVREKNKLIVNVKVVNLTGHKFPSGVNMRRAFIELKVRSGLKNIWISGATDQYGVIGTIDRAALTPLNTEFFNDQKFQPHRTTINREEQVQIYEQLLADSAGEITTSFLRQKHVIKDNRLLPQGWRADGPDAEATHPVGVEGDDDYANGSGVDQITYEIPLEENVRDLHVSATLFYQSLPPYYLQHRFRTITWPNTQRLYYLFRTLDMTECAINTWKLQIAQDQADVK